jgi:prevent-host-death family protein
VSVAQPTYVMYETYTRVYAVPTDAGAEEVMMDQVAITDARDDLAEVVNRVTYRGDRVVLTRRGKRLVAVVPIADLELLERLEKAADLEEIRSALSDPDNAEQIPWERLKTELGL